MSFWPSDTAGVIADAVSVLAFLGSVAAGISAKINGDAVRRIEKRLERRERLPHAARDYQKLCREIAPMLFGQSDPQRLSEMLGRLSGTVKGIEPYLRDDQKAGIRAVRVRLEVIAREPNETSHLRSLHTEIWQLSTEIDFVVGSMKWDT
jgi:hypothetical protein